MTRRHPITLGLFLFAEGASLFGNAAISIVLPWLVLARTGDPALTGLVAAVSAAPSFIATLVSGHLIDRVGRRRMSVLADIGSALSVAALLVVDRTLGLDVFWFIALGLLGALFDVPGMTARETLLPNIAKASGVALEKVAGLRQVMFSLALLAGPGAAGVLMAVLDPMVVVAITAACSGSAALCMAVMPLPPAAPAVADGEADPHAGALGGWRFVRSRSGLMAMLLASLLATLPVAPLLSVILPAHFSGMGRSDLLGFSMSAFAIGSMAGSVLYAVALSRWRWPSWVVAMLLFTGALTVVAPLRGFWLVALGMMLAGIAGGLMGPVAMVAMSEHVPDRVRGRVMALFNALSMVTAPLGLGLMALLLTGVSIETAAWICCLAFLPVAAYSVLAPGLKSFVEKPKEVQDADDRPTGPVRRSECADG